MNTAKTILSQIKSIDPMSVWAWGAKDFVATSKGLQFRTGGLAKFKGLVHIKYNEGSDLYDVDFLKMKKGMPSVVSATNEVYADMLVEVIDSVVQ